jgi:hypothetical protein
MPLICYVKTTTNKRLLISRSSDDSNRCTPYRRNLIHMTHMLLAPAHIRHIYAFRGQSPYVTTFHTDPTELDRLTAPDSTSQLGWVTRETHLSFSPKHIHWSSALKTNISWRTCYIGLPSPYHHYMISMFNTCLREPTHRSLTDIGGGYNLGSVGLLHHTPRPFQPTVLHFSPKGPTRSQVKHPTIQKSQRGSKTRNLVSGSLHSTSTIIYHLSIALLTVTTKWLGQQG